MRVTFKSLQQLQTQQCSAARQGALFPAHGRETAKDGSGEMLTTSLATLLREGERCQQPSHAY